MPSYSKFAASVFGDDSKPKTPEWKQIQDEEAARRDAMLAKQKAARLARDAALASSSTDSDEKPSTRSKSRKPKRPAS